MIRAGLWVAIAITAGCGRREPRPEPDDPWSPTRRPPAPKPAARLPPSPPPTPCADLVAPAGAIAPRILTHALDRVVETRPLRWVTDDERLHALADDGDILDLGASPHGVADDRYNYEIVTAESCAEPAPWWPSQSIYAIDRVTRQRHRVADDPSSISTVLAVGDQVYWAHSGGLEDQVYRAPRAGGAPVLLATTGNIVRLHEAPGGIVVRSRHDVTWIPRAGGAARRAYEGSALALATDDRYLYIAERGRHRGRDENIGTLVRVAHDGGQRRTLVGPGPWPSAVAAHGGRVYYVLADGGDIWSVPRDRGAPRVAVPAAMQAAPCVEVRAMWSDPRGLYWMRGDAIGLRRELAFLPWSALVSR